MMATTSADSGSQSEKMNVGIFWECNEHLQLVDLQSFCHLIIEIGKTISTTNVIDKACALVGNLSPTDQQLLRDSSFKTITKEDTYLEQSSLLPEIFLWLWDLERSHEAVNPCVIIITENVEYSRFLREFKDRSVSVICIPGFILNSGHQIWDEFKANCDLLIEQKVLIHHTNRWLAGDYKTLQELAILLLSPFMPKLSHFAGTQIQQQQQQQQNRAANGLQKSLSLPTPANTSQHHDLGQIQSQSQSQPQNQNRNRGVEKFLYQGGMQQQAPSLNSGNQIEITDLLPPHPHPPHPTTDYEKPQQSLAPHDYFDHYREGVDVPIADHYSAPSQYPFSHFTQEQLQLQEDLTNAIYAYNVKLAVSTLRKMYTKQSKSFRIPLILSTILPDTAAMVANGRTDLVNIVLCFILDCIQWCFGVQKGENFESFKYKMNTNIARWLLRECVKKGVPSVVSNVVSNATVKLMDQILDNYLELNFTYELLQAMNISQPIQRLVPYIHIWLNSTSSSMKTRVHEFLYEHPEFSAHLSASEPDDPYSNSHYPQTYYENGDPSYLNHHDLSDQVLEYKLLSLLEKSVNGELGARIPTLYRDEYGESLRLRGRKLKDILIETGKVEMYGADGPGDKLFRIIPSLAQQYPSSAPSSASESNSGMKYPTNGYFDQVPAPPSYGPPPASSNKFNIDDYLRDNVEIHGSYRESSRFPAFLSDNSRDSRQYSKNLVNETPATNSYLRRDPSSYPEDPYYSYLVLLHHYRHRPQPLLPLLVDT